ncbi:MAG: tRNA (adenosine(37)-N6)-dimethylallyltransferase MiaA [Clostridiales bacterium]|nr:tRNA (adenosine(37)-N6)-dimethylallyltransferase MiaA [Clostridiales bacterium]
MIDTLKNKKKLVVLAGPTASGKTAAAIHLAHEFDGEIVSADSMQLYKYMDIGSAKPTKEEQAAAKHHMIDFLDPREPWSVAEYQKMAKETIADIFDRGKLPIICGGTGLYVNSILYEMNFTATPAQTDFRDKLKEAVETHGPEYVHAMLAEKDPEAAERIHPNNVKKVIRALEVIEEGDRIPEFSNSFVLCDDYECILTALTLDRPDLYDRINQRAELLMEMGLIEEVRGLLEMGLTEDDISMKGIGYKEVFGHLRGEYDMEETLELIRMNTRRYAKRQITWFKRYPGIQWFNISEYPSREAALEALTAYLRGKLS